MTGLLNLLDSARYRAEVKRLGPVLARHQLWLEADRRARRIADRLVPPFSRQPAFRFEFGPGEFIARSVARSAHNAKRMIVLDYARDQILAKLERRVQMATIATELLHDCL